MKIEILSVARGRSGARWLSASCLVLAATASLSAQVLQSFGGAAGETPYTVGSQAGLVPLAPTAGHLSLLRVDGSTTPTNSKPFVVFDATPDLSGATATGSVVIEFDFKLSSGTPSYPADGFGVALLATSAYGSTGAPTTTWTLTNWERPSHASAFSVGFDIYESYVGDAGRKNQVSLNWNGMQLTDYNQGVAPFWLKNDKWNRVRIEIRKSGVSSFVTVRITEDLSLENPTTHTLYDDFFVSGMNLPSSRLAFGARTGGCWTLCDLDNVKTGYGEIHVNPTTGLDGNTGSSLHPVATIASGVSKALARETVRLSAGTHSLGTTSTPGTVTIDKQLTIRGAGASGAGRTTVTGEWTDVLANADAPGNALLYFTGNSDGSTVDGIEFVGGASPTTRRIAAGIRLLDASYMTIENCAFLNIYNAGVSYGNSPTPQGGTPFPKTSNLKIRQSAFTNCGWENTVATTGLEGAVGGMIMGVGLMNSEFSDLTFTHTSTALGTGGYGIKTLGLQTDNLYTRITTNLKPSSSWKAHPTAGQAPCFAIETNKNQGYWDQVYNNIIEDSTFNNPLSIAPGEYAGYLTGTNTTFRIRNNVFNTPGEYNIETLCSNTVIENNYSKRGNLAQNTGTKILRLTVRNNVSENVRGAFVVLKGDSDSLLVYNNTVHFGESYSFGYPYPLLNPVFVWIGYGATASTPTVTADTYRGIYNNFVTSTSPGVPTFMKFGTTAVTNYNNQFIRNNHVHNFAEPSSVAVPGLGDVAGELANNTATSTSGGVSLTGNLVLGGTLGTTDHATYWQPRAGATQLVDKGLLSIPTNTSGAQGTAGGTFITIPTAHYTGASVDLGGVEYIPPVTP